MKIPKFVKKIPFLSFIGFSNSGKTVSLETFIEFCKQNGHDVIAVKHTGRSNFTIDTVGKNTWKYAQAGAKIISSHSKSESALIFKDEFDEITLLELIKYLIQFPTFNAKRSQLIILCEGFRDVKGPKILCASQLSDVEQQLSPDIIAFSGKISADPGLQKYLREKYQLPVINTLENPEQLYSLLIKPNSRKKIRKFF